MKQDWARLTLLAAGFLAARLALYAFIIGHVAHMPDALCHRDCSWYVHTALSGYDLHPVSSGFQAGQANWAFLPLYPLLMHILAWTGISAVTAGFMISNACFLGFMLLSYRYLCLIQKAPNPFLFFGFLVSFPFGLYFSFTYTESLYALLTLAVFTALAQQQKARACLLASLLSATRVTGILILPVLAVQLLWLAFTLLHRGQKAAAARQLAYALPLLAIVPLGLALFMAYLYLHVGDALAFIHVQAAWHRTSGNPFLQLATGLTAIYAPGLNLVTRCYWVFLSLCGIGGLILAVWIGKAGHLAEAWFLGMTVLVAASAGLLSLQRLVLANPIFLVFLFLLLSTGWRRRLLPVLIAGGALLQLHLLHLWLLDYASVV